MTDFDHENLSAALSRLRTDVRRTVAPPAAPQLRLRADRRQRARRTGIVLAAAVLVGAVLVGGGLLWNGAAPQPFPGTTASPTAPAPSASGAPSSGTPTAGPRPSRPVQARQTPQVPDRWKGVDWTGATITLPPQSGCPSGSVTFRRQPVGGGQDYIVGPGSYPKVYISPETLVYGDLTGDGQPEAILGGSCSAGDFSGDGEGQLLVVRGDGGTLRANWAGPRGELRSDHWVEGGRLLMDVKPHYTDWGYRLGAARAYRWTGQAFTEESSGYLGVVPAPRAAAPSLTPHPGAETDPFAVHLGPVAELTGCPAATLRLDADGRATAAGTTWDVIQPQAPDYLQHLVDLDGDGRRRLLVTIACGRTGPGTGRESLVVLERQGANGWRALDALRAPDGTALTGWQHANGTLTLQVAPPGGVVREVRYTWNGEYFQ